MRFAESSPGLADFTAGQIERIAESNLDGDVKIGKGTRQIHTQLKVAEERLYKAIDGFGIDPIQDDAS